jgi:hypothetical protein
MAIQPQIDPIHSPYRAIVKKEVGFQVFDIQDRVGI